MLTPAQAYTLDLCIEALERAAHRGLGPGDVALTLVGRGGALAYTVREVAGELERIEALAHAELN